ncbi:MAG: pyridoxamine 5'-phosphate oxidase family protein, partial [Microthrixaceae bacterium]
FEVAADAPPYRGVRGHGVAEFHPDKAQEVLAELIERYLGQDDSSLASWLRSRVDDEVAIAIAEMKVTSWDYSERMT